MNEKKLCLSPGRQGEFYPDCEEMSTVFVESESGAANCKFSQ
jgi:hypothetical protein